MATVSDSPAPLRLPAILQNPTNTSQRQVEAFNAQQRESLAAKREAKGRADSSVGTGRGKRVVRRIDNAAFTDNPHIVAPRRTDLYPSVPLQPRPSRPSFPPQALDRSARIPGVAPPDRDPFSESSVNGAFTTSLKGTRALLRKRGHRAEGLVGRVESVVRGWMGGDWEIDNKGHDESGGEGSWKVVDDFLVDLAQSTGDSAYPPDGEHTGPSASTGGPATGTSPTSSRRLPPQHRIHAPLPPMPVTQEPGGPARVPAVLELSRSIAHLSLAAVDPFDRLVVHLIARYYECISWSEEHVTSSGQHIRLTHVVVPSIARPRASAARTLLTPETTDVSDLSGLSGSERSTASSVVGDSDTETERGTEVDPDETFRTDDVDGVQGYILDPNMAATSLTNGLRHLELDGGVHLDGPPLARTHSAGSSMYASSEAESDYSSVGGLADSMTFPAIPPAPRGGGGTWLEMRDDASDAGSVADVRLPAASVLPGRTANGGRIKRDGGWVDKPTFFEYLYGA